VLKERAIKMKRHTMDRLLRCSKTLRLGTEARYISPQTWEFHVDSDCRKGQSALANIAGALRSFSSVSVGPNGHSPSSPPIVSFDVV